VLGRRCTGTDGGLKIYLNDFGMFLGRERNRFVVKKAGQKSEFASDDVDSIIFTSRGAAASTGAFDLAVSKGIQIVFARYRGWPYGILMPTSMTGSVRARREQFLAYNDERGFRLGQGIIVGKLLNQANLLKLMAKNRKQASPILADKLYSGGRQIDGTIEKIQALLPEPIDNCRQTLMNLEAEAARTYWEGIAQTIPEAFKFPGRKTRGATDPINAMLNFGYQVTLFPEVWKAVTYAGLDPYAGFLHADRPGKPSLVLDMMEEFRQQVVDRTIFSLVNLSTVKPDDFQEANPDQGRTLNRDVTRKLLEALEERLTTTAVFNEQRSELKGFILSQTRRATRLLLRETMSYQPFFLGW
jgi:CRISPR-associated protein Cas1